jgi:phage terminase small subunit
MMVNGKRGRTRKTTEQIKRDNKNYQPDRHGYGAIQAPAKPPRKPSYLTKNKEANALWLKYVPQLIEMGHVTELDVPQLTAMCEWWARYRLYMTNPDSRPSDVTKAYETFRGIASKFGMTPYDRQKLREWNQPEAKDELDEFFSHDEHLKIAKAE